MRQVEDEVPARLRRCPRPFAGWAGLAGAGLSGESEGATPCHVGKDPGRGPVR